jgi:phosphate transport system substrate-binding protein
MPRGNVRLRAAVSAAAALAALGAPLLLGAAPAAAVPAADGQVQVLAAAGSDTTQDVVGAVLDAYRTDRTANPDADQPVNIPVRPAAGGLTVPADATCAARAYVPAGQEQPPASLPAPAGSGAGKNALKDPANLATACVDVARSSSGRAATDPAEFEYYGYARDAVSWAHFAGAAPAGLTLAQLRDVYSCAVTNWRQLGGQDAPIVRYLPPAGSGTRTFFVGTVLGAQPATSCGEPKVAAENDGTAVPAADRAGAVLPYSVAQWVAQANGAVADVRAGVVVGPLGGENPVSGPDADGRFVPNAAVVNGGTFPGVRTVYNVLDTRLPSYGQALRVVGFDAAGPGFLCAGSPTVTALLTRFGFTPLPGNTCTRS